MPVMKYKGALIGVFSYILLAQSAVAENERYVTGFVGLTELENYNFRFETFGTKGVITTEKGMNFGVAIGVHLFSNMRAEFELSQSSNDTSEIGEPYTSYDGSINASFALANLWYDLPTETKITPYVGGGLGYAQISHEGSSIGIPLVDDSDTAFAAQIGIGGRASIGAKGAIDIGYRYKVFDGADLDQLLETGPDFKNGKYASHSINIGYSYNF
jgi:opacity protein-like surface antigen